MVFSSIPFLYFFLPVVLLLSFLTPKKGRNFVLLLSGSVFYFYGQQLMVFLMLFTATWDYACARLIAHFRTKRRDRAARTVLISALGLDLGILCYFKYTGFFLEILGSALHFDPVWNVALPIGISFYTFQSMSYVIDVYRQRISVQKNLTDYMTYLTLFPQLIAGPIVRYERIAEDLAHRECRIDMISGGIFRFVIGLAKKVLIANVIGEYCSAYPQMQGHTTVMAWLYAVMYALQVYFDFSGYSDMAIGLGRIFGFRFDENFNYPFTARSISEFWRRWHISLGTWFRDYLYIPLGGNRRKWFRNVLIVWFLTGMWHGAGWNFILWGLFNAFFLVIESLFLTRVLQRMPKWTSHLYVVCVLSAGFVIFSNPDMDFVFYQLSSMFGGALPFFSDLTLYYLSDYAAVLLFALIGSTPAAVKLFGNIRPAWRDVLIPLCSISLFLVCTAEIVDAGFNPFLYFRF